MLQRGDGAKIGQASSPYFPLGPAKKVRDFLAACVSA
jgi:hypothetical protein